MSKVRELELEAWDPETQLATDTVVLCVGARGAGKTTMMLHVLYGLRNKLDFVVLFCPTKETREQFEQHVPKCFVYDDLDVKQLTQICSAQLKLAKRKIRRGGQLVVPQLRRIGIILDDCMTEKALLKCPALKYLVMNGRHEKFFLMIGAQYIMNVPKDLRTQTDVAIVFPDANPSTLQPLRENVLGIFHSDEELAAVFQNGLGEREALVFDSRAFRSKRQCTFYCLARVDLPPFLVGSRQFWEMYYRYFVREDLGDLEAEIAAEVSMHEGRAIGNGSSIDREVSNGQAPNGGTSTRTTAANGQVTTTTATKAGAFTIKRRPAAGVKRKTPAPQSQAYSRLDVSSLPAIPSAPKPKRQHTHGDSAGRSLKRRPLAPVAEEPTEV